MSQGFLQKTVIAALEHRLLALFFAIILAALGVYAFVNMSVDAVPDISNIQVTVTTNARGLAPKEVEQYVTYPVEMSLQGLPHLTIQRSISKYALSQVTVVFSDGTDIYWARQQVSERLKAAQEQMPASADISMALGPIATGLGEIYQFEVRGSGYSLMQLRDILDWQIIPALKTVPGVDEVQSMGGESKEYQVWLDPERLHGYKTSLAEIFTALSRNNANAGGGYAVENSNQILIRGQGMLSSVDDIENVVIKRVGTGIIRIKDLGRTVIGKKLSQSIVTHDGHGETVIGVVVMRKGENSKKLVERVKSAINKLQPSLPSNVRIIPFYDRSELIDRTVETVKDNLLHGALLVLIVLFVLLGSINGGIISALAIPLSLCGALLFLSLSGISGNLLSLGAIDFGILIDGSVVMVEHIQKQLAHKSSATYDRLNAVKAAATEVCTPIFFAVLIITIVYVPILLLPGVSGKTFQPMALTVVFGLLTALLIALYLTPTFCYYLLEKNPKQTDSLIMKLFRYPYRRMLLQCAKHPFLTLMVAVAAFAASLLIVPLLGTEFVPVLKEGSVVLTVTRPVSGSLETAARQTTLMEKLLREIPEVDRIVARTGHSEIAFDPMGPDETDMYIIFKAQSKWPHGEIQQDIEDKVAKTLRQDIPGIVFTMSQPIEQRMNELVAGAKGDVAVRIFGPDLDKLRELGGSVAQIIEQTPGNSDIKLDQTSGLPILTAALDRKELAAYGVAGQDALDTVTAAIAGKVVGTIYEGKPRYPLTVRFAPDAVKTPEEIGGLPVAMSDGELVPLVQLASIKRNEDAAQISHIQAERIFTVQTNVRNRDLGSFVADAQKRVNTKLALAPGYRIEWGGQFENMQEAQEKLLFLVPIALVLIFILLFALYGSLAPGILIFTNIPLAFSGGLVGLMLRGMHLSVTAGVGFIALFGVAVLNGVVLVSTIRELETAKNMHPRQAAMRGAAERLRPVLMTALVASLGFVPMAIASSVGAEVQRPLATVVIAGLITSTILTLLVLPSVYPLICKRRS